MITSFIVHVVVLVNNILRKPNGGLPALANQTLLQNFKGSILQKPRGRIFSRFLRVAILLWCCLHGLAQAQSSSGELRLHVADASGLALASEVTLDSDGQHIHETLSSGASGDVTFSRLPYGVYRMTVRHSGFATVTQEVTIRSALPKEVRIIMRVAPVSSSVVVKSSDTLTNSSAAGSVSRIGKQQIEDRPSSLPGRGVIDLVDSEPGWLYEGNAVLHPRGSEYQTQFVLNGIPLTENRSPGSGSELAVNDVQSMSIYTAGIPAEYGRKLGGVVEVNTLQDPRLGLHGQAVLAGGSFSTANAYLQGQYGWGRNQLSASADGAYTQWYENPPVVGNFTNSATTGSFSGGFQRDFSQKDRLALDVTHEFARFLVPNENVQQTAGQRQHRATLETLGTVAWQHIFSPQAMGELSGMVRDDTALLTSNQASTPIIASQNRGFREAYSKGSLTLDRGNNELKAGFEGDFTNLHEQFAYSITDPTQFDPGTPAAFQAFEKGRDREQALFVEDTSHWKDWNLAAGLRWDNYELLVHQSAFSPRLALSRHIKPGNVVAHISYDRVFQTPAIENLLISSSAAVTSLDPAVLRLPVRPSDGNYYEAGLSRVFWSRLRFDGNTFLRRMRNFADDNPLLDTSITFPISFRKASIYGAEGKLEVPGWGPVSGFVNYSYMVGSAYLPVTGGLFLGDMAAAALSQTGGRLWVSQDQRNTARARWRYQLPLGLWGAAGADYGSGLPEEFSGTVPQAVAIYGQALVNRVNFSGGRVRPSLAVSASAGADFEMRAGRAMHLQADVENLNNRLNLIDFQGLFSGNAVAPPRSYNARLSFDF